MKLLWNHRATRIASIVETISAVPALILEIVGCQFATWTLWIFEFILIGTCVAYIKHIFNLFAHDHNREHNRREEPCVMVGVIRVLATAHCFIHSMVKGKGNPPEY